MNSIYTIVYVTLNTALKERVSMGLLLCKGNDVVFKYSPDKLLAIKGLINSESYNFCKIYLKSLENDINTNNETSDLFEGKTLKPQWITEGYTGYLANYSNNLIQFSEPRAIEINFDDNNFKRLFEKYIYAYQQETHLLKQETIYDKVKTQLYPKISNRVNLKKSLNASHFHNLFAPIEVGFIGINGIPVVGQTIDFVKNHYHLENDVARYVSLTKAIDLEKNKKGKYFVVGNEPKKTDLKNHLLWSQIRDSNFLEFVEIDDVGVVESYIENNDVKPYFTE